MVLYNVDEASQGLRLRATSPTPIIVQVRFILVVLQQA